MKKINFHFNLFDETGLEPHTIKSLKLVILAVAFGTISFNITGGVAMTGYLKTLGASDFTFGLLYAIGPIGAAIQILASYILERTRKRKLLFLTLGIMQRMSWLPFGLVPFFVPMDKPVLRIWMASVFLIVSAIGVPFVNVTFNSLAADLVPMEIRGSYFAVRSRIATIFGVGGGIFTAWLLDSFSGFTSYAFVFTLAAIAGTMDIASFFWVKFPPMHEQTGPEQSGKFTHMLSGVIKDKGYMKFIIFMTLWQFSLNLSAPFYLVYLRNVVVLSNTLITILIQILPNICSILIITRWGRAIDLHGNKTIMQITNGILCAAPFIWIFVSNKSIVITVLMVSVIGLMQGFLSSGFDVSTNNIMLGHAPKVNRSMFIAVYFMTTTMIGVGA
ncbi:MAG: MFS transporter, partial [Oscillospiraceae bacterium]|nr:MFS transporter [Oscillospiraceae bacterium]